MGTLLVACGAAVAGCGLLFDFGDYDAARTVASNEGGSLDEGGVVVPPDSFVLSVEPSSVNGTTNERTNITLRIRRGERFTGEVSFLPPEGDVVLEAPPIAPGATESVASLLPGGTHGIREVTIVGTSRGEATAKAVFRLDVRGRPGTLDTTFGTGGVVELADIATGVDVVTVDDDRLVVATREVTTGTARDALTLARLTQAGTLDPAFGVGGRAVVVPAAGGDPDGTQCVARGGTPGSLLVAGQNGPKRHLHLAAADATGKPVTTFGSSGTGSIVIGTAICRSLSVLPDGALLIAASTFLQKRATNGAPDPTWADAGEVPFGDGGQEELSGALPEGTGYRAYGPARTTWPIGADGSRGAPVELDAPVIVGWKDSVRPAAAPDGRAVVGGTVPDSSGGTLTSFPALGLLSAGAAVSDFASAGFVLGPSVGVTFAVVAAGSGYVRIAGSGDPGRVSVVRYDKGGPIGWSFDGSATAALATTRVNAATVDSRGRIVVVGARNLPNGTTHAVAFRLWN